MQKRFLLVFFLPIVALLSSCGLFNSPPEFDNDVGWVFENIHPSFWTKDGGASPGATAFRNFWIHAEDPDGQEDITYVCVTDSENVDWVFEDAESGYSLYNDDGGFWGGWVRYFSSFSPYRIALGTHTTVVRDSREHEISRTDVFNGPGGTPGYSFAYAAEEDAGAIGGTPLLARATALSGDWYNASHIEVRFTVTDTAVFDGYVWLYDSSANYVGWTDWFHTMGAINNAGANTFTIDFSDLDLGTHDPSEIYGFHVVLTDGAQYTQPPDDTYYDNRSISEYKTFTFH
jgi:hypothetical protein